MDKYIRVTFSDGRRFDIHAYEVARIRAAYYVEGDIARGSITESDKDKEIAEEIAYALTDTFELLDYLSNHLNWEDVLGLATEVEPNPPLVVCYQHEWTNAHREIVVKPL